MTQNFYVAFLRGVNVGGHTVKMDALKKAFEQIGLRNIQTVLASGNVLFESSSVNKEALQKDIEVHLTKTFGFSIPVIIRTKDEIEKIVAADPFKSIVGTPDTRLYITFLSGKHLSEVSFEKAFQIVRLTDTEICMSFTITEGAGTTDMMRLLEKTFGKNITTRNWNTINKVSQAFKAM